MDHSQKEKQNQPEMLDQNKSPCYDQCKGEDSPEEEAKIKTKQDIPVAFAIPAHEVSSPSHHPAHLAITWEALQRKQIYNELHTHRLPLAAGFFSVLLKPCFVEMQNFCFCIKYINKRTQSDFEASIGMKITTNTK